MKHIPQANTGDDSEVSKLQEKIEILVITRKKFQNLKIQIIQIVLRKVVNLPMFITFYSIA